MIEYDYLLIKFCGLNIAINDIELVASIAFSSYVFTSGFWYLSRSSVDINVWDKITAWYIHNSWQCHDMETLLAYQLALCEGIPLITGG